VFRLENPAITDERCRACSLFGGVTVRTAEQAVRLSQLLERPVEVDEQVIEDPCVADHELSRIAYESGGLRRCPRVELDPENDLAAQAVALINQEHLRAFAPRMVQLGTRFMDPDVEHAILSRVTTTAMDERVRDLMFPPPKKETSDG
jgi:hypothetical protein